MGAYQDSKLSRDVFEEKWSERFAALFRHDAEEGKARWLPDQVFTRTEETVFYHPQPYYLRQDYRGLEQALLHLGEDEFVVVDRDTLYGEKEHVGILFRLQQRAGQVEETGRYHIEGQPSEFYAFGKRHDWGFVSSEPYNIGVLNAHEAILDPFTAAWPGADREEIQRYLEHTPSRYKNRFESNYLERREGSSTSADYN